MVATAAAKWARRELGIKGCTAKDVAAVVPACEWHHSSKFFNRVNYYSVDDLRESAEELAEEIAARKRNSKPGLQSEFRYPLVRIEGDWFAVELKNGQLAAARYRAEDFCWVVRAITEAERIEAINEMPSLATMEVAN